MYTSYPRILRTRRKNCEPNLYTFMRRQADFTTGNTAGSRERIIPWRRSVSVGRFINKKTCWITIISSISSGIKISIRIMSSEVGNENVSKEKELPPECYQEDALYYDFYQEKSEDDVCKHKTQEQKLQILKQLDEKKHSLRRLEEVYPNIQTTTVEKLEEQIKQFEELKKQGEYKEYCQSKKSLTDTIKQQEENEERP